MKMTEEERRKMSEEYGCGPGGLTPADISAALSVPAAEVVGEPVAMAEVLGERDIFEVANQLGGYVGPGTEERLAKFLIRESKEAAKLASRISQQDAELERLRRELAAERESVADLAAETTRLTDAMIASRLAAREAREQLAEARKALEPFAEAAASYDPPENDDGHAAWAHDFTIGSLRRARATIAKVKP